MRIALISFHYAEYADNLAAALASRGHDVLLICSSRNFSDELGEERLGEAKAFSRVLLDHARHPLAIASNAWRIVQTVRRFGPDVIHLQETIKDYLMLALPWLTRFPLALTVHDPQPHSGWDSRQSRRLRVGGYRSAVRRSCDVAFVHGHRLGEAFLRDYPRYQARLFVVPHGPLGTALGEAEAVNDWEVGNVLFFGRIHAYKGLRFFVEAVERLHAEGLRIKGVIAGRGSDLENYRSRVQANEAFELLDAYVSRGKLRQLFRNANVVVLPYTDASQSGVAAMAMGFGRPIVASRVGSLPEFVLDKQTGLLVPPRDVDALAAAIRLLIEDQGAAANIARGAREACLTSFSWQRISEISIEAYKLAISLKDARHRASASRPADNGKA